MLENNPVNKTKVLITGGSGFIGTNLVQYYLDKGFDVLSLDPVLPKNKGHSCCWKQVDILNYSALKEAIDQFTPDYLVHLAARTDLNEKNNIDGYRANYQGTENIIKAIKGSKDLKRVIFASSMLVCRVGYIPKNYDDYAASTLYGQSKVLMEKIIKGSQALSVPWVMVRPTSIWGPWFGEPYISLFNYVMKKKYFLIADRKCIKTCGYVGNTVWQIDRLLFLDEDQVNKKTFYLGDQPYYDMAQWAQEIADECNVGKIKRMPYFVFKLMAIIGDILSKIGITFPMTSFRLKNMTTNNQVPLDDLYKIIGAPPYSRKDGVRKTLQFLRT